jgi:hypothetical protein
MSLMGQEEEKRAKENKRDESIHRAAGVKPVQVSNVLLPAKLPDSMPPLGSPAFDAWLKEQQRLVNKEKPSGK